jgi:hypothetical protein
MARYTLGDLVWRVTGDTKDYDKSLQTSEKKTKAFSLKSLAIFGTIATGAVVAFKKISQAVAQNIEAYGKQVQAESSVRAAIRATGQEADDVFPRYEALARKIQKLTTVGDEASWELIGLATSMGVTDDQMEDTIKGAIGLSDAFGIGTRQALRGVANALEGNFETLQRYIPALRTAETEAEKLRLVQEGMANGFEVSQARAQTAFGAIEQYRNAVGDLREQLGQSVAEGIEPFVRGLQRVVEGITESISETRNLKNILEELEDTGETTAGIDDISSALERLRKEEQQLEITGVDLTGDRLAQVREQIRLIEEQAAAADYLNALEMRYGEAGREELARREEAALQEAEAQARAAEINRVAYEKRIEIAEDYSRRLLELEGDTFDQIERAREEALADAADSYVRSGEEIEQINRYYDALRAEEQERIAEEDRQRLKDLAEFQRKVIEERRDRELETLQEIQKEYERTADAIFSYLSPTFEALGEALSDVEDGWVSLGKTAVQSIAVIIRALAREFAIRAAGAFAIGRFARGAALAAASAAALVASGVVSGLASQISSAAEGADFTTNGPQLMLVGDNPGGKERVTVEPLSSPNMNGPQGDMINIQINLDGEVISKFITRGTRSGQILVDQRSVV